MDRKNLVVGTKVELTIPVFSGNYRNAKHVKDVVVLATVVKDSYGHAGKHWFTFEITESEDSDFPVGKKKRMQGKNAYKNSEVLEQPADVEEQTALKGERKIWESFY